jgi:Xaa-Pro aminopeptidase
MRRPSENVRLFSDRRAKVAEKMSGATLIVASNPEFIRNHDVEYPFRQDSNLYYLTGFEEPDSIFVFRPGRSPETVLFVRTKNIEMETWTGFRYGPELAQKEFKLDATFPIEQFSEKIVDLLKGSDSLIYRMFKNHEVDEKLKPRF